MNHLSYPIFLTLRFSFLMAWQCKSAIMPSSVSWKSISGIQETKPFESLEADPFLCAPSWNEKWSHVKTTWIIWRIAPIWRKNPCYSSCPLTHLKNTWIGRPTFSKTLSRSDWKTVFPSWFLSHSSNWSVLFSKLDKNSGFKMAFMYDSLNTPVI